MASYSGNQYPFFSTEAKQQNIPQSPYFN
uniref:Uncharacterized protein n=1 Tax=Rhizophora mucronata TaxID=61149 RepID=A0A2P2R1F8_RHIMU